ncbi:VOC family protein [Algoriphagus chordae]|uniref:Catechol 2,3-dioxygenase-like lactoylglutathione lyase family enzyme n=1 Tax=Algoriphagus chordae TaxID=237019 RepID=A0A2W7QVR7_9BACT|nr:VOC family protein [Algoriphagus chordae]PZX50220.1 catechol 2,3-dioxygenase-like lactoylglutathione lyase family enzyme [Algoriphagus chordae]
MKLTLPKILSAVLFLAIGLTAGIAVGTKLQTEEKGEILGINHIAIVTEDFEKSASYYRDTLGFPLAIEFKDQDGNPAWSYFQVSKSTFIELVPASASRPAGLEHFGLETSGTESLLDHLREMGLDVNGPRVSSLTGIHIGTTKDLDGVNIEFIGAVPGSVHRKAIDDWDLK